MWPPEAVILKSLLEQRMLEQHSALDRLAILASSLASISSYLAIPNRVPSLVSPDLPLSTPMSFNPAGLFSDAIIGPILISAFCSFLCYGVVIRQATTYYGRSTLVDRRAYKAIGGLCILLCSIETIVDGMWCYRCVTLALRERK